MQSQEDSLRSQIALGWVISSVLQAIMLGSMIVDSALADNAFLALRRDPGVQGMKMLAYLFALYSLMPIYVYLVHKLRARLFRWIAVGWAFLAFFFFLLHHLSHWYAGQRPDFNSHLLDLVIHLVGLWVIVNSIKWATIPSPQTTVP